MHPAAFGWRAEAYEFVRDIPAIDLLTGGPEVRRWIDAGRPLKVFREYFDEGAAAFRRRRRPYLLYPC